MSVPTVMHLIDGLGSGGAERMVVNLVNALPRSHWQPVLCTSRFEGKLGATVSPDVKWIRLNRRHRFDLGAVRRLADALRDLDVKIIHAHSTSLFLALAAARLRPETAVLWHDHYGPPAGLQRKTWIYGPAARRSDAVVTVSEISAKWTRERLGVPAERVRYIPNFISEASSARERMALPGVPGSRIVCVAGMRPEKDLINLIRAMNRVVSSVPQAHLLLIGPPKDATYAQAVQDEVRSCDLQKNVTWLGEQTNITAILKGCNIGVLSSVSEGFPVVLLEYGLAGLGVVSTDVGQCAEILHGGRAGCLVPSRDPAALASGMLSLLGSAEMRFELGRKLAERTRLLYSAEVVLQAVGNMYLDVLKRRQGRKARAHEAQSGRHLSDREAEGS